MLYVIVFMHLWNKCNPNTLNFISSYEEQSRKQAQQPEATVQQKPDCCQDQGVGETLFPGFQQVDGHPTFVDLVVFESQFDKSRTSFWLLIRRRRHDEKCVEFLSDLYLKIRLKWNEIAPVSFANEPRAGYPSRAIFLSKQSSSHFSLHKVELWHIASITRSMIMITIIKCYTTDNDPETAFDIQTVRSR